MKNRYPTINRVIFAYNILLDIIDDFKRDESNPTLLGEAATVASMKLTRYYGKTDESCVYAIATAMDPTMKFEYWEDEEWEECYLI